MKKFIQLLARLAGVVPSSVNVLPVVPVAEWTAEDAFHWKQFLQTPAGQSLWQRARARQAALCVDACDGKLDPKTAGGFTFTLNWLESLANHEAISSAELAKSANAEAPNGEPETLESNLAFTH